MTRREFIALHAQQPAMPATMGSGINPRVSGDRCGDAVGFSLSTRRRCKGRRQAEKAGVTPRIARTILRSADGDRPRRRRFDGMDTGYMLAALFVLPCGRTRAALVQQCQTEGPTLQFAERALRNIWPGSRGLLRLDAGERDHFGPLLDFGSNVLAEISGWAPNGVAPRSASRACILGSDRAALIALLRVSITSAGVLLGARKPPQKLAS